MSAHRSASRGEAMTDPPPTRAGEVRPHTLVVLLHDRPGALHRAVSLFRRRGYNIASLTVGRSEQPGISRMTVVVDARDVRQVIAQLARLLEVLAVSDVTHIPVIVRETALLKVGASAASRESVLAAGTAAGARVADVGTSTVVFEMTDAPARVEQLLEVLRPHGILELVRSGQLAMRRGVESDAAETVVPFYYQADGMADPDLAEE